MSKKTGTFKVEADPHAFGVYHCESWSDPENPYLVDLFNLEGNGTCTCTDFQTRCWRNWKDNGHKYVDYGTRSSPNKDRTVCKHIKVSEIKWTRMMRHAFWVKLRKDSD